MMINNHFNNAPKIWGIVNITPDSFSDGGLFLEKESAHSQCLKLIQDGADYLDLGAASSRPTSEFISPEEEWARLEPVLSSIENSDKTLLNKISVDTWRADVAKKVLEKNIFCINDISAFQWEPELVEVLSHYKPYYVMMHCQGTPDTMQQNIQYDDVVDTVFSFFEERLNILQKANFPIEKVILDPGIGFGKNLEQNLALMNAGEKFSTLGLPLMAAVSRKSWLRLLLSIEPSSTQELDSMTACASVLLQQKNYIHHRVHNVQATKQALLLGRGLGVIN